MSVRDESRTPARLTPRNEITARLIAHTAKVDDVAGRVADAELQNAANLRIVRQQADQIIALEAERDAVRAERDAVRAERDTLESRLAALTFVRLRAVGSRIHEWLRAIAAIGRT